MRKNEFSPVGVIQDVLTANAKPALLQGLGLRIDIDDNIPERVFGAEDAIRQALNGLVANAVKHTRRGDITVSLDIPRDTVFPELEGLTLRYGVKDTGCGLSPERIAELLDSPLSGTTSLPDLTASLGAPGPSLADCRRLAAALDGGIQAESEPGKGSFFRLMVKCGLVKG